MPNLKPFILSGTGTRKVQNLDLISKRELMNLTLKHIAQLKPTHILSGMAEGFDSCLAWAAVGLNIPFTAVLPTASYPNYYWKHHSVTGQDRAEDYVRLIRRAAEVVCVSPTLYVELDGKRTHANMARNQYLVNHSHHMLVLKVANKLTGGTADCLRRIHAAERDVTFINFNSPNGDSS